MTSGQLTENPPMRVVLATFPDITVARQIGTLLVEKQLIACVNLVPGVESIYEWDGKVNQDNEILGVMKVPESKIPEMTETFVQEHPYDVPELLVMKPDSGLSAYVKWVGEIG